MRAESRGKSSRGAAEPPTRGARVSPGRRITSSSMAAAPSTTVRRGRRNYFLFDVPDFGVLVFPMFMLAVSVLA